MNGGYLRPKAYFERINGLLKISLVVIQLIHRKNDGFVEPFGMTAENFGTHFNAILGVDNHYSHVTGLMAE